MSKSSSQGPLIYIEEHAEVPEETVMAGCGDCVASLMNMALAVLLWNSVTKIQHKRTCVVLAARSEGTVWLARGEEAEAAPD